MAYLTDVTEVWYACLEQGKQAVYSDAFLDKVAFHLRLAPDERDVLYHLALWRPPKPRAQPLADSVSDAVRQVIDAQPWPAWVSDASWEILVCNKATAEWLPHTSWEPNVMRWVYKYKGSQGTLVDWETKWAQPMLAQMRAARAMMPWNTALAELVEECLEANAYARDLWVNQPETKVHPDGDRRQLILPHSGGVPTTIEIVAFTQMRNAHGRIVSLVPVDGFVPQP